MKKHSQLLNWKKKCKLANSCQEQSLFYSHPPLLGIIQ